MDTTARLLLQKPNSDPVTGDDLDVEVLNANFDKIDGSIGAEAVTSSTRPVGTARYDGKIIRETDTGIVRIWDGVDWRQVMVANGAGTHLFMSNTEVNITRTLASGTLLYGQVAGESTGRFLISADGQIQMGPGNTSRDVNLYRGGANLLKTDDTLLAAGAVCGLSWESIRDTTSPNITNQTETIIQTLTFPAVAGCEYLVNVIQNYQSNLANDLTRVRLRWQVGNTLTIGGNRLFTTLPNADIAGRGQTITITKKFFPNVTGNVTVGVTFQRESATAATVISFGQTDRAENIILVAGA